MEIQSSFQAGLQGFNQAQQDATDAASAIVQATTVDAQAEFANAVSGTAESSASSNDSANNSSENGGQANANNSVNLNQEIVNLKVAEFQAKASSEVIQTADETLGTILDVSV